MFAIVVFVFFYLGEGEVYYEEVLLPSVPMTECRGVAKMAAESLRDEYHTPVWHGCYFRQVAIS